MAAHRTEPKSQSIREADPDRRVLSSLEWQHKGTATLPAKGKDYRLDLPVRQAARIFGRSCSRKSHSKVADGEDSFAAIVIVFKVSIIITAIGDLRPSSSCIAKRGSCPESVIVHGSDVSGAHFRFSPSRNRTEALYQRLPPGPAPAWLA